MKTIPILISLIILTQSVYSQNVGVNWGNAHTLEKEIDFKKMFAVNQHTYILRFGEEGTRKSVSYQPILEKYDTKGNLLFTRELQLPFSGDKYFFGDMLVVNEQIGFTVMEETSNGYTVYLCSVNSMGETSRNYQKLMQVSKDERAFTQTLVNQKQNEALFCQVITEKNQYMVKYVRISSEWKVSESQVFKFDVPTQPASQIDNLVLDNHGNIRILWHGIKADGKEADFYELLTYHTQSQAKTRTRIDINPYLVNGNISADPQGFIYFFAWISSQTGEFAKVSKENVFPADAVYYAKFDHAGNMVKENREKLSPKLLPMLGIKFDLKKYGGFRCSEYYFKNIVFGNNQQALSLSESSVQWKTTTGSGMNATITYTSYHSALVGFLFDTEKLSLLNSFAIPKLQITTTGFYSSYFPFAHNNTFYLIYNDNKANVERPLAVIESYHVNRTEKLGDLEKAVTVLASISGTGSLERKVIEKASSKSVIAPRHSMFHPEHGITLYSFQWKERISSIGKLVWQNLNLSQK